MVSITSLMSILGRVLMRPWLIPSVLRAGWRFRARGWWRRVPFLPLPPMEYLEWRLHTAYGDEGRDSTPGEVERYVRWTNRMQRGRRSRRGAQ